MAKVLFVRDTEASILDAAPVDGTIYVSTDTDNIYIGTTNGLQKLTKEYQLSKSGNSIILKDDSGKTTTVTDSNTTYNNASQSSAGLMSASDKAKLDGIASNANKYTLPIANSSALGGIKTDYETAGKNYGVKVDSDGSAYVNVPWSDTNTTYTNATQSADGLMSSEDKIKLDGIEEEANKTIVDAALSSTSTNPVQNKVINSALSGKADTTHNHSASQITSGTLDAARIPTISDSKISSVSASKITGTIPQSVLPSYVDDVLEFSSLSSFPDTGETGKIYVATDTNKTYRWSGSSYVEISASLALGTTSSTAFRGDYGNTAYQHATAHGNAYSSGLYKITTNSQGHVTAATAVTKSDITALGIPGSDTNTNTTYTLSKSGSTITLKGSDGSSTSVTDSDTNTTYSSMTGASSSSAGKTGLVPAPSAGASNRYLRSDGTWQVPPDTNTTYTLSSFGITATASELNHLDGITATVTELNYTDGVTSNIQTQLNNKAALNHTHNYAGATSAGGPATLANQLNTVVLSNKNLNDYHTGGYFYCGGGGNNCTNKPSGIDNFGMIVFQTASGWTTQLLYGSDDHLYTRRWVSDSWTSWVEIYSSNNKPTPAEIGAATSSHTHSNYLTTTGTAAAATKLATSRTISLTGDVTGSASFNGTANASISAQIASGAVGSNELASGAVTFAKLNSSVGTVAVQSTQPTESSVKIWIET